MVYDGVVGVTVLLFAKDVEEAVVAIGLVVVVVVTEEAVVVVVVGVGVGDLLNTTGIGETFLEKALVG